MDNLCFSSWDIWLYMWLEERFLFILNILFCILEFDRNSGIFLVEWLLFFWISFSFMYFGSVFELLNCRYWIFFCVFFGVCFLNINYDFVIVMIFMLDLLEKMFKFGIFLFVDLIMWFFENGFLGRWLLICFKIVIFFKNSVFVIILFLFWWIIDKILVRLDRKDFGKLFLFVFVFWVIFINLKYFRYNM